MHTIMLSFFLLDHSVPVVPPDKNLQHCRFESHQKQLIFCFLLIKMLILTLDYLQ